MKWHGMRRGWDGMGLGWGGVEWVGWVGIRWDGTPTRKPEAAKRNKKGGEWSTNAVSVAQHGNKAHRTAPHRSTHTKTSTAHVTQQRQQSRTVDPSPPLPSLPVPSTPPPAPQSPPSSPSHPTYLRYRLTPNNGRGSHRRRRPRLLPAPLLRSRLLRSTTSGRAGSGTPPAYSPPARACASHRRPPRPGRGCCCGCVLRLLLRVVVGFVLVVVHG